MQTPVEIDFQGMEATPRLRSVIADHVTALEDRFGRVSAGRVVLKAPDAHHRTGGLYEINIHLSLPGGRAVNVARTPQDDERHSNLDYAINDGFKRARRQLQDQVRQLQGQVKQPKGAAVGTVKELDPLGAFGFIATEDGRDVYFHRNSVLGDGFSNLTVGSRVTFAEEVGDKGPQASTVKPLPKHQLRA